MISQIKKYRELTIEMARRELSERYAGQVFGVMWALVHPLVFIVVYLFLFVFVFKVKIGGTRELPLDYTTYLLSGLVPWLVTQDVLNKSGAIITGATNLVKQVVFPLEILPVKTTLAALPGFLISLVVILGYVVVKYQSVHLVYVFLPILIFLHLIFMLGWSYLLSALGVFFRDTKDFVQVIAFVCMYFMPIFYLPASVPGPMKLILYINPFSYLIWSYQDILYFGDFRHWWALAIFSVMSFGMLAVGLALFRKLKPSFANVL
ncbi:MAG: ABC transporter permease [Parvibaculaceae bacterium]|nr:ABC transporter permease [Parvibaculaceae bacterium]|tara:strand:- start:213 stop:1001 length:789 start_codon:yes stop_codon:yes gene_type:complete